MIAAIVLSSRYRPLPVWIGAAVAMVVNSALAVLAGRLLELLPHRWVEAVVAALFAAGALYLLLGKESAQTEEGEEKADKVRSSRRVALGAFTVSVVADLGDRASVRSSNVVARDHNPW